MNFYSILRSWLKEPVLIFQSERENRIEIGYWRSQAANRLPDTAQSRDIRSVANSIPLTLILIQSAQVLPSGAFFLPEELLN